MARAHYFTFPDGPQWCLSSKEDKSFRHLRAARSSAPQSEHLLRHLILDILHEQATWHGGFSSQARMRINNSKDLGVSTPIRSAAIRRIETTSLHEVDIRGIYLDWYSVFLEIQWTTYLLG